MAVQTITYDDKSYLNQNSDIADVNKINDTDMNEIKSVVNNNATQLTNITGQILWTNPNPTSSFGEQTITLSSSDYDMYEIIFTPNILSTSSDISRQGTSGRILKGYGTRLFIAYAGAITSGANVFSRLVDYVSDTEIKFYVGLSAYGTTSRVEDNQVVVPIYIIGYKTGLFS